MTQNTQDTRKLAVERIRRKVRALIKPTALDFFEAAAQARLGLQVQETRHWQELMQTRDRGRAAAIRLSALAGDPNTAPSHRYDSFIRKHKRGK